MDTGTHRAGGVDRLHAAARLCGRTVRPAFDFPEDNSGGPTMTIDSAPQPCPRCLRPTVLVTHRRGRDWLHVGTWLARCGRVVDAT
jgi:hypothetical protein